MQGGAVVDEQVGRVDIEVAPPEGGVAEPAFGLFGQAVDEHERLSPGVGGALEAFEQIG